MVSLQLVSFNINSSLFYANLGVSLLEACLEARVEMPSFCYNQCLSIAGNCSMCLVEVKNSKKLVASCATPLINSFFVFTGSFRVKKARQSVLEFLLINHPLDCPICDQGGECDLQDITLVFGGDSGSFYEVKKSSVFDKNLGSLMKTMMNSCMHCTSCVRFFMELEGSDLFGLLGSGQEMEIGTFLPKFFLDALSGNVIDLCPVGALTSKPFAFTARSWELFSIQTIDMTDVSMPNISVDMRGGSIMRVLPSMDTSFSGWISNKTRFCYDSMRLQRLLTCLWVVDRNMLFSSTTGFLFELMYTGNVILKLTWRDAFKVLMVPFVSSKTSKLLGLVGALQDFESVFVFKNLLNSVGSTSLSFEGMAEQTLLDLRHMYIMDPLFHEWSWSILQILLCGVNLRMESPLLYFGLQRQVKKKSVSIFSFGSAYYNFKDKVRVLGVGAVSVLNFIESSIFYSRVFFRSFVFSNFYFLLNYAYSSSPFSFSVLEFFSSKTNIVGGVSQGGQFFDWEVEEDMQSGLGYVGVLQRYAGLMILAELGCSVEDMGETDVNSQSAFEKCKDKVTGLGLFLGTALFKIKNTCFNVLFGSWAQDNNDNINLILPSVSFLEKAGTFMNFMGKLVFKDKIMSSSFDLKSVSDVMYNFMEYMYGSLFVLNSDRGIFTFMNNKLKFKLSSVTAFFSDFFGWYLPSSVIFKMCSYSYTKFWGLLSKFFVKASYASNFEGMDFDFMSRQDSFYMWQVSSPNFYYDSFISLLGGSKTMSASAVEFSLTSHTFSW